MLLLKDLKGVVVPVINHHRLPSLQPGRKRLRSLLDGSIGACESRGGHAFASSLVSALICFLSRPAVLDARLTGSITRHTRENFDRVVDCQCPWHQAHDILYRPSKTELETEGHGTHLEVILNPADLRSALIQDPVMIIFRRL